MLQSNILFSSSLLILNIIRVVSYWKVPPMITFKDNWLLSLNARASSARVTPNTSLSKSLSLSVSKSRESNSNQQRTDRPMTDTVATDLSLIKTFTIGRILRRCGKNQFVLSVFLHHQPQKVPPPLLSPAELFIRTREPRYLTASSSNSNSSSVKHDAYEPDFEVLHRYSEFVKLRNKLIGIATEVHAKTKLRHSDCAFCKPLLEFLNHDSTRPCKRHKLFSSAKTRMQHLAAFTRKLTIMIVNRCVETEPQQSQQGKSCNVALQASVVLEEFLKRPRQLPVLGII